MLRIDFCFPQKFFPGLDLKNEEESEFSKLVSVLRSCLQWTFCPLHLCPICAFCPASAVLKIKIKMVALSMPHCARKRAASSQSWKGGFHVCWNFNLIRLQLPGAKVIMHMALPAYMCHHYKPGDSSLRAESFLWMIAESARKYQADSEACQRELIHHSNKANNWDRNGFLWRYYAEGTG